MLLQSQVGFSHWATVGYCEHAKKAERDERDVNASAEDNECRGKRDSGNTEFCWLYLRFRYRSL